MSDNNFYKHEVLELQTDKEKELANIYRKISLELNDDMRNFVNNLSDYSVYNLFEPFKFIEICKPGFDVYYNRWRRVVENNKMMNEMAIYRKKVYHLLKDSGYDDGYIEDNIEKHVKVLFAFYTNPDEIIKFVSLFKEFESINNYKKFGDVKTKIKTKDIK